MNRLVSSPRKTLGLALLTSALTAGPSFAAQPAFEAHDQTGVAQQASADVEEIIVTAQKRAEDIQSVPIAVTPVSAQTLALQNIQQPSQLVFAVPSLQQQGTGGEVGATNFSIRGVGTAVFGPGIEASVAPVIDDVTLARPQLGVSQFFDIDNVQVLRGPQGMLFGKNASSGVVSINTRRPLLGTTSLDVNSTFGYHDTAHDATLARGDVTFNTPLTENSAARVSVFDVTNESPVENIYRHSSGGLGLQEVGGRAKFLWKPNNNLEIYLSGDYVWEQGVGDGVSTERKNAPGGVLDGMTTAAGIVAGPNNIDIAADGPESQHFQSGGAQANITYHLDGGSSITDVLAYRRYQDDTVTDIDYTPTIFGNAFGGLGLGRNRDLYQVSEELRLTSPGDQRLTYQVGLYYLNLHYLTTFLQAFDLQPLFPPPPPGSHVLGMNRRETIDSDSKAVFGQAEYHFTDALKLMLGARFTHDSLDGHDLYDATGFAIPLITPGDFRASTTQNNFSYRIGPQYQIADSLLYFTYSRGYKGPALDETTLSIVRPEIPTAYEVGMKTSFLDRRLQLDLALFRTDYANFQAQALVGTNFLTVNAGSLRVQGFEAEFRSRPVTGLSINGGLTLLDATYTSFTGAPCYPGQPTGMTGRDVCLPSGRTDVSGDNLANAPRASGTLLANYEHPLTSKLLLSFGGDVYYRSSVNYTPSQDPQTRVGGMAIFGAQVGIEDANHQWRASLFAHNLFDKRFPTYVTPNPIGGVAPDNSSLGGDYYQVFGQESFRTIGIQLSASF
jgi:iron complex outermembrane receptor protein